MSSSLTQSDDAFGGNDPAISFSEAHQTWTVDAGVLVSTGDDNAVVSTFAFSVLFNNGTILSSGEGWAGVAMLQDDSSIANAIGASIIGGTDGIFVADDKSSIDN